MRPSSLRPAGILAVLLGLAAVAPLAGCSTVRSWMGSGDYRRPPTALGKEGPVDRDRSRTRVVVVGVFEDPAAGDPRWPGVGRGMSDVLARTLLNHGDFDVIVNPRLAKQVDDLAYLPAEQRNPALETIRREHPDVRLVVNGRVTDFMHTDRHPDGAGGLTRTKRGTHRAIAAIQLNVFDLDRGRTVATDHLWGTETLPAREDSEEAYAGIAFDTVLFWSSPMGRATNEAIDDAVAVLNRMIPTATGDIVVVEQLGNRTIRIAAGSEGAFSAGGRYYVYELSTGQPDADGRPTDVYTPVFDPATRQQLRAHVRASSRITTTAYLYGQPGTDVDLLGTVLLDRPARWSDVAGEDPLAGLLDPP